MDTPHFTRENSSWCPSWPWEAREVCASKLVSKNHGRVIPTALHMDHPVVIWTNSDGPQRLLSLEEKGNGALCWQPVCMSTRFCRSVARGHSAAAHHLHAPERHGG